jgi:hypothetical protein
MNSKAREWADIQRIERGFVRPGDSELAFPETMKTMSKLEQDMFWIKLRKKLNG